MIICLLQGDSCSSKPANLMHDVKLHTMICSPPTPQFSNKMWGLAHCFSKMKDGGRDKHQNAKRQKRRCLAPLSDESCSVIITSGFVSELP